MSAFRPPDHLIVFETDHWIVNHRVDSILAGYLMVGAKAETNDLSRLPDAAQAELGRHLATTQRVLRELFHPPHIYFGRYGHDAGHSIHFHVIPVYTWVMEAFEAYRNRKGWSRALELDGSGLTHFIWREFCESESPPEVRGPSVAETVRRIRREVPDLTPS